MAHSKGSVTVIKAALRREEALRHRLSGATYRVIADRMGCSEPKAWLYVNDELARLNKDRTEIAEDVRRQEVERLDALLAGLWDAATGGDIQASTAALRVMERRAKLLGLDAPTRLESTGDCTLTVIKPVFPDSDSDNDSDRDSDKPETD